MLNFEIDASKACVYDRCCIMSRRYIWQVHPCAATIAFWTMQTAGDDDILVANLSQVFQLVIEAFQYFTYGVMKVNAILKIWSTT